MLTADRNKSAARLLTASLKEAHAIEDEWQRRGVALFLVGPAWEAVKLPAHLVHDAADGGDRDSDRRRVRARLRRLGVEGPVALVGETYVVLVPPGTAATWDAAAECVATTDREAHYMGLPSPYVCEGPRAHWVIPPGGGPLNSPSAVRALVEAGAEARGARS